MEEYEGEERVLILDRVREGAQPVCSCHCEEGRVLCADVAREARPDHRGLTGCDKEFGL